MINLLTKLVNQQLGIHEVASGITLFFYTGTPTASQMATRWDIPEIEIHQIYYKLSRARNKEQAVLLFKSILYLVEAGIYTNLSQVQTKLDEL